MSEPHHDKENLMSKNVSSRSSHRSSILKDVPERKPLEIIESNPSQRRSLKRVSFADTNTIKEFLASMEAGTVWNNTYETPASSDTSSSIEISTVDKSMRYDDVDDNGNKRESSLHIMGQAGMCVQNADHSTNTEEFVKSSLSCGFQTAALAANILPDDDEAEDFVSQFLNIKTRTDASVCELQSTSASDARDDADTSDSSDFLAQFLGITPSFSSRGNIHEINTKKTGREDCLTQDNLTQKFSTDMEMTCTSDVAKVIHDGQTQKFSTDMETTCTTTDVVKVIQGEQTQKFSTDMETTCTTSDVVKVIQGEQTQKFSTDMEMTCTTIDVVKVIQGEQTQKFSTDMETTCTTSDVVKVIQGEQTQKFSTDMETTCTTSDVVKLIQGEQTQKFSTDMETTCTTIDVVKVIQGEQTQKFSTDMETTCTTSDVVKVIQGEQTQKFSTDMEMTCTTSDVVKVIQGEQTQMTNTDMEVTFPAREVTKVHENNPTWKIGTGRDMTFGTGEVSKVIQKDVTQTITTDMEQTYAAGKLGKLIQDEQTWMADTDMEMTYPAREVAEVIQNYPIQIRTQREMPCTASTVTRLTQDEQTRMIDTDIEMTYPAREVAEVIQNDPTQIGADMELTCGMSQLNKTGNELLQTGMNIEPTFSISQVAQIGQPNLTNMISINTEKTHPVSQIELSQSKLAQISTNITMASAETRIAKTAQDDLSHKHSTVIKAPGAANPDGKLEDDPIQRMTKMESSSQRKNSIIASLLEQKRMFLPSSTYAMSGCSPQTVILDSDRCRSTANDDCVQNAGGEAAAVTTLSLLSSLYTNKSSENEIIQPCRIEDAHEMHEHDVSHSEHDVNQVKDSGEVSCTSLHVNLQTPVHPASPSYSNLASPSHTANSSSSLSHTAKNLSPPSCTAKNTSSPTSTAKSTSSPTPTAKKTSSPSPTALNPSQICPSLDSNGCERTVLADKENSEEMLDDINLSLVSMADNSTDSCSSVSDVNSHPLLASVPSGKASESKSQGTRGNRIDNHRSLVAEGDIEMDPLTTSIIKLASMMQISQSCSLMLLKDTPAIESVDSLVKSRSFTALNMTPISLNRSKDCHKELYVVGSSSQAEPGEGSHISISNLAVSFTDEKQTSGLLSDLHTSIPADQIAACIQEQPNHAEKNKMESASYLSPVEITEQENEISTSMMALNIVQQKCDSGCCLTSGSIFNPPSGRSWIVQEATEREIRLQLKYSPLELILKGIPSGSHWTITSASWHPQPSEVENTYGKLILNTLGCRVGAAMIELCGLTLCGMGDALVKVFNANQDIIKLMVELQVLSASYLTTFTPDSVMVTHFSQKAHVSLDVMVRLEPPQPTPDKLYTLHPSASITIGNLRLQTVEEVMAGVGPGPQQLLRMMHAVNSLVQSLPCRF
ncbi:hypothetical protein OTU49_012758 [Cherax quadricarinatus]|uniref:Uncharacterized protein n=1 Tax=Cherax quadricarinatus TaxID=27406 RepID=A0AAW0VX95_CHEQU